MENALFRDTSIGPVLIEGNLFLAPLAGYTDRAFRSICRQWGAFFAYSEMVSSEGLARDSVNTAALMQRGTEEQQLGIQIFLNDAAVAQRSLPSLLKANPTVIDINCGCPVPKVVKTGSGSALLKTPQKIYDIVQVLTQETTIPVSVKIRTGWDHSCINYLETADAALSGGASMLTMHARTKSMGYSGKANWRALKELKLFIAKHYPTIPLFGSGDLFSAKDAQKMLLETGVDGVMFARGAMGNPFIFKETIHLLTTEEELPPISLEVKIETLNKHLYLLGQDIGEEQACRQMRKHAPAYLSGIPHAKKAKQLINQALSYAQYAEVTRQIIEG